MGYAYNVAAEKVGWARDKLYEGVEWAKDTAIWAKDKVVETAQWAKDKAVGAYNYVTTGVSDWWNGKPEAQAEKPSAPAQIATAKAAPEPSTVSNKNDISTGWSLSSIYHSVVGDNPTPAKPAPAVSAPAAKSSWDFNPFN